jgi:hypothetical protein
MVTPPTQNVNHRLHLLVAREHSQPLLTPPYRNSTTPLQFVSYGKLPTQLPISRRTQRGGSPGGGRRTTPRTAQTTIV